MICKNKYILMLFLSSYGFFYAMAEGDAFFSKNEMDLPLVVKHVSQRRKIKREKKFQKDEGEFSRKYPQDYKFVGNLGLFTFVEYAPMNQRAKL